MNATPAWTDIEPLLDEAMHTLDEADRAAVVLRYFENKSLREFGQALGTSENAAQKRLSRALGLLRDFFARQGVTIGASGLILVISANAVKAAPMGMAASIATAVAIAETSISAVTAATTKAIVMTSIQKAIVATAVAGLTGVGIYELHETSRRRSDLEGFRQ